MGISITKVDSVSLLVYADVHGSEVIRPLPPDVVLSEEKLSEYLSAYEAGLYIEFPGVAEPEA